MCESAGDRRFAGNPDAAARLRAEARRLAGEMEAAGFRAAAELVAVAAEGVFGASGGEERTEGRWTPDQVRGDGGADVGLEFELDEHGRVWMIREGDCWIVGRRDAVCAEMRRFLASVVAAGR